MSRRKQPVRHHGTGSAVDGEQRLRTAIRIHGNHRIDPIRQHQHAAQEVDIDGRHIAAQHGIEFMSAARQA